MMDNFRLFTVLVVGVFCLSCSSKDPVVDALGQEDTVALLDLLPDQDTEPDISYDMLGELLDGDLGEGIDIGGGIDADKDGWTIDQGDCDDANDKIFPGSTDHVEGVDYDCDLKREYTVKIDVIVDDAYGRLCVNDRDIGSSAASYMDRRIESYTTVMESGLNIVGINGKDIYGGASAMAMSIKVNGRLIRTNGSGEGDPDVVDWRYFPKGVDAPRLGWCSRLFDDEDPPPPYSPWGPAILAYEEGNGEPEPPEFRGSETDWVWDGSPRNLKDSWFRLKLYLPNAKPIHDPPSANPACSLGQANIVPRMGKLSYEPNLVMGGSSGGVTRIGLTWSEFNFPSGPGNVSLYSAILASDGSFVVQPTKLFTPQNYARHPVIAWNGTSYGVAFECSVASFNSDELCFARVSAAGELDGAPVLLTNNHIELGLSAKAPWIAAAGGEFGVVWHSPISGSRELYFARMSETGEQIGENIRLTDNAGSSITARILFDGTDYAVVWSDEREGSYDIYFAKISTTGEKIGSDVRVTNTAGESRHPTMVFANSQYTVAYQDDVDENHEIYLVHIDANNVPGVPIRLTADQGISDEPTLAYTGSEYIVVWRDDREVAENLYVTRVDANGLKIGGDEQITNTTQMSAHPYLIWLEGQGGLLAWEEREMLPGTPVTTPVSDIYIAPLTCK
ncbi:MAG: hypothetical protein V1754_04655 [Pseudomonadota bacterium]